MGKQELIMKLPYEITSDVLNLVIQVSEKLGEINASHLIKQDPELRRKNCIKTIQSTLAIEGNSLSLDQVTAIFDNKRVLGSVNEITEVKNVINVYNLYEELNPFSLKSFLNAHQHLMKNLVDFPGRLRTGNVGITKGKKITHIAPPASNLKGLMNDLFKYLKKDRDSVLIKSCVFHYEMEFIHPFCDGNGRMGRLWHTLILASEYKIFKFLPIESMIKERQKEYYRVLNLCDAKAASTDFIIFMLEIISEALESIIGTSRVVLSPLDRINLAKEKLGNSIFSRKDYMRFFKEISAPTASRDLRIGIEEDILIKTGDKRLTVYQYL